MSISLYKDFYEWTKQTVQALKTKDLAHLDYQNRHLLLKKFLRKIF
ncbi:MAG: DUF29 family protein [Chroococcidiopsidaceae cyanobacterium CP_BM_RX_35]|nr:DUF29 family protein [Chroococcidiopsidaceae cyanobacterium CP_BM_RX_35]